MIWLAFFLGLSIGMFLGMILLGLLDMASSNWREDMMLSPEPRKPEPPTSEMCNFHGEGWGK